MAPRPSVVTRLVLRLSVTKKFCTIPSDFSYASRVNDQLILSDIPYYLFYFFRFLRKPVGNKLEAIKLLKHPTGEYRFQKGKFKIK